jgi:pimeloyl-ACP methyl ester carboxylesterase
LAQAMREGWFERGGVRLHFREWDADGNSAEPIVFLHGLSSNARYWTRVAERLSGRRMLALDQRSHGLSDRPADGYTHEELAGDAAALFEHAGVSRAVVAGHSWGAAIALEVAAARPDLVSGLAFIDGPAASMSEVLSWEQAQQVMQPALPRYGSLEEAVYAKRSEMEAELSWGDDLVPFVEAGLTPAEGGYVLTLTEPVRFQILKELFHYHPELLWPRVECPVAILLADTDTPFGRWKRRSEQTLRGLRPDADIRWFRSPHDIPLHAPDEVALELERLSLRAGFGDLARDVASLAGDWKRPTPAESWTAHDLLAHISSTQGALAATVASVIAGDGQHADSGREPFDPDRWNASQIRRRRERSTEDLLVEIDEGTAAFDRAVVAADLGRTVTIGSFAGSSLAAALRGLLEHQRSHLAELRSALA